MAAPAQEDTASNKPEELRIYEREPFDRLTTTDDDGKPVQIEIRPVLPPDQELPKNPPPDEKLRIRPLTRSDDYFIAWRNVKRIERFQEMILAEANAIVRNERLGTARFDTAFDYYAYLYEHYPNTPGLSTSVQDYLIKNAGAAFKAQRYDEALAMLIELHRLNPDAPGVDNALAMVTDKLVATLVATDDFRGARSIIAAAQRRHGDKVPPAITAWREKLIAQAEQQKKAAIDYLAAERYGEAHAAGRRMIAIWPKLPGAAEVLGQITQRYPQVDVGVMQPARPSPFARRLANPAARRVARLLDRMLVERKTTGTTETEYFSPSGTITPSADRTSVALEVGERSGSVLPISAFDLSQRVLALADPAREDRRPLLAHFISRVVVADGRNLDILLQRPHVRPDALFLGMPITPDEPGIAGVMRPYRAEAGTNGNIRYVLNPDYALAAPTQPRVVTERYLDGPLQALKALDRGEIDVLDRVYPWQVERLRADDRLMVGRYAQPTVHVLIPRTDRPPLMSRVCRRALVYAIDRQRILDRQILDIKRDTDKLDDKRLEGCVVVSGPFPRGTSDDDPRAYAYDPLIDPRKHDPRLAWALLRAAEAELRAVMPDAGSDLMTRPLVLAYPADELIRGVCESIERYLEMVGLKIELKELPPGQIDDETGEYDLLYSEWTMTEPVVDVWRLVEPGGVLADATPHFRLPLRQLSRAATWQEAREQLREMHRIAHAEVTVVPLWQLMDFFAVRKNVQGVKDLPDVLYSNIESWRITPWIPED